MWSLGTAEGVNGIVEALYTLDEPWRGRFLVLTANLATGWRWGDRESPGRDEITAWLDGDCELQKFLARLLCAWSGMKAHLRTTMSYGDGEVTG